MVDDELEGHFQALRSVYKRSSATVASPELSESEIVHIDIYQDPTGKDIIRWEGILGAFKGADNVRHKTRSELIDLTKRSSQYGSEDVAFYTSKDFDLPTTEPRPQTTPNDAIGGQKLESASPDVDRIADLIAKADRSDMDAQVELGYAYETGKVLAMDRTSAMKYFRKAANRGHAMAHAIEWLRKAIENDSGDDVALFEMGMMYYQGRGVPLDFPKAEESFIGAGNLGNVDAKRSLGVLYRSGRQGVAQDSVRAMEWFHKAADQNDMESQFTLGVMYDNGEGVVRDSSKAME
ncbi:hypothetical protein BGX30_014355 [Mortierella sp. GBA39]|nr:hypothetical protein BGX30_014355 [Mortierella sp. GBA39]